MLNLLGDQWFAQDAARDTGAREPAWEQVLALPGVHLHLYGKAQPRPGRKMGHLNVTGATVEGVRDVATRVAALLGVPPPPAH
jgi:5-(carboxyamino)imidazole ribonucleotide synthase